MPSVSIKFRSWSNSYLAQTRLQLSVRARKSRQIGAADPATATANRSVRWDLANLSASSARSSMSHRSTAAVFCLLITAAFWNRIHFYAPWSLPDRGMRNLQELLVKSILTTQTITPYRYPGQPTPCSIGFTPAVCKARANASAPTHFRLIRLQALVCHSEVPRIRSPIWHTSPLGRPAPSARGATERP
ncbi:hypothetical protein F4780DRAFT_227883 [Xylariomycetidae sp. FL0641]|nr:hypothetical protein F4780DRAFT_227883 [Xylariomycetidae sp. FL0641]